MLIQPFINVNLANGWYNASSPIITSDWMASNGRGWTVPIGGGFGRIFRIGSQPFNASFQGFWDTVRPEQLGDKLLGPVTIRLQIRALFPTGGQVADQPPAELEGSGCSNRSRSLACGCLASSVPGRISKSELNWTTRSWSF